MTFKNAQWTVTDFGLEAIRGASVAGRQDITPPYEIAAKRLLEATSRGNKEFYDWPVHMAEKTWVDVESFIEAWTRALEVHEGAYKGAVDKDMFAASVALGRRIASGKNA